MKTNERLFLHEEIMLLALRDVEGTVISSPMYEYAIGGAILAELLLNRRIGIEQSGKKAFVKLRSSEATGDPLIDECIGKIGSAKRRATLQTWTSRFAGLKNLKHRVASRLCERGILRADQDTVLLIFNRTIYPELDPAPEQEITERLRRAIFSDTEDINPRTVVLLSLAHSADLLKAKFDRKMLKAHKPRIERIIKGEIAGEAAKEAIEAMQAAIMVAVIVPAITTATTVH